MASTTKQSMKKVPINKKQRRCKWWDNQCSSAVSELETSARGEEQAATLGCLQSAIRAARRSLGDSICALATPTNVHKLTKWYQDKRDLPLPPLKANSRTTTIPDNQAQMLRDTFFPATAPPADSLSPLGVPHHPTRTHQRITAAKINLAVSSSNNNSALGAFGSNYHLLKWFHNALPNVVLDLLTHVLSLDSTPSAYVMLWL
ncbi:hypothetical protein RSOLAG1IB_10227 [Rhizoctonia solani AG-1 IB]|nr:hypothetical protein RSOLAG1IB_10227 [Rhizoctonia solani AG-1 IB]